MKTILWFDDDEELLREGAKLFRKYDFEIIPASNTSRALTILRERERELDGVLLDVKLPRGESGLEFLDDLSKRYPNLKIVVFTGYQSYEDQINAQRRGAVYFLKVGKRIPVGAVAQRKFFEALHEIFDENPHELPPSKPISIFCSYSHKDESLRRRLDAHLADLKRSHIVSVWHDREIGAGQEWAGKIDENIKSADLILLLISANFMASDYCNDIEVKIAMERHELKQARVIPIVLRAVDWHSAIFAKLQALPTNAEPVTSWKDREKAFMDVAHGISVAVKEISQSASTSAHSKE